MIVKQYATIQNSLLTVSLCFAWCPVGSSSGKRGGEAAGSASSPSSPAAGGDAATTAAGESGDDEEEAGPSGEGQKKKDGDEEKEEGEEGEKEGEEKEEAVLTEEDLIQQSQAEYDSGRYSPTLLSTSELPLDAHAITAEENQQRLRLARTRLQVTGKTRVHDY